MAVNLQNIQQDLTGAQLARDDTKVSTLRLLLSEIKNAEIAKGEQLGDQELISVIQKEAKKRKEAIEGFRSGDREEQAQKEEAELKILQAYLPAQMPIEELTQIVDETIKELGATNFSDMGKVMGGVMGRIAGRADGNVVSSLVKERLSK